jgi:hypothetical protein
MSDHRLQRMAAAGGILYIVGACSIFGLLGERGAPTLLRRVDA